MFADTIYFTHGAGKTVYVKCRILMKLESLLENVSFLKVEIIYSFVIKEEKNEEVLVNFAVTGADHGL